MYPGTYNPGLKVYNPRYINILCYYILYFTILYNLRVRPGLGSEPVEVAVNLYVRAVEDIDDAKNVRSCNRIIQFRM